MKKDMIIDSQEVEIQARKEARRKALMGLNLSTRKIENKRRKAELKPKYKEF